MKGGKRQGAGRKPSKVKRVPISLTLDKDVLKQLDWLCLSFVLSRGKILDRMIPAFCHVRELARKDK